MLIRVICDIANTNVNLMREALIKRDDAGLEATYKTLAACIHGFPDRVDIFKTAYVKLQEARLGRRDTEFTMYLGAIESTIIGAFVTTISAEQKIQLDVYNDYLIVLQDRITTLTALKSPSFDEETPGLTRDYATTIATFSKKVQTVIRRTLRQQQEDQKAVEYTRIPDLCAAFITELLQITRQVRPRTAEAVASSYYNNMAQLLIKRARCLNDSLRTSATICMQIGV
jgi:hypothetical protein